MALITPTVTVAQIVSVINPQPAHRLPHRTMLMHSTTPKWCPSGAVSSGRRAETTRRRSGPRGYAEPPVWLRLVSPLNNVSSGETKRRDHLSNHGAAWQPGEPGHYPPAQATAGGGRRSGVRGTGLCPVPRTPWTPAA
jgi:hypothetical protein